LTAVVRGDRVSLALLTCDRGLADAYERAFDARAGERQPWQRFTLERAPATATRSADTPPTALERAVRAAPGRDRDEPVGSAGANAPAGRGVDASRASGGVRVAASAGVATMGRDAW
jgi:hypothetical protein